MNNPEKSGQVVQIFVPGLGASISFLVRRTLVLFVLCSACHHLEKNYTSRNIMPVETRCFASLPRPARMLYVRLAPALQLLNIYFSKMLLNPKKIFAYLKANKNGFYSVVDIASNSGNFLIFFSPF